MFRNASPALSATRKRIKGNLGSLKIDHDRSIKCWSNCPFCLSTFPNHHITSDAGLFPRLSQVVDQRNFVFCVPVCPPNNPGLLLWVAAEELWTLIERVRVSVKAPARLDA